MTKQRLGKAQVTPIAHTQGGTHYRDENGNTITQKQFNALKAKSHNKVSPTKEQK